MFKLFPFNHKELFVLAIAWTHLIFYGCTIPGTELPEIRLDFLLHMDKLVHAIFFLVFFLLWSCIRKYTIGYGFFLVFVTLVYGLLIEYYQFNFVDGRGFELADLLADVVGALIGLFVRPYTARFLYKDY